MSKIIANLVLIIVTGLLLIGTYSYVVSSAKQRQTNEIQQLKYNKSHLDDLLKSEKLTHEYIKNYDVKYETTFSSLLTPSTNPVPFVSIKKYQSFWKPIGNEYVEISVNQLRAKLEQKNDQIKNGSFWGFIPPWQQIILGFLATFFGVFITSFANFCQKHFVSCFNKWWAD